MVLPYEHVGEFWALSEDVLLDYMTTAQLLMRTVDEALSPHGFNVGFNIGAAGGASIDDHLHMHIIPRWRSDTSFMPLTANTAVVEEAVDETYVRLQDRLLDFAEAERCDDADALRLTY
jgi:ATP adenylyltransferase